MAHGCRNAWDTNLEAVSLKTKLNTLRNQNQKGWGEDLQQVQDYLSLDSLKSRLEDAVGWAHIMSRAFMGGSIQDPTLKPAADVIAAGLAVHAGGPDHCDPLHDPGQLDWLRNVDPEQPAIDVAEALLQALKDCLDEAPGGGRRRRKRRKGRNRRRRVTGRRRAGKKPVRARGRGR